jgi:hypothetical protein
MASTLGSSINGPYICDLLVEDSGRAQDMEVDINFWNPSCFRRISLTLADFIRQ